MLCRISSDPHNSVVIKSTVAYYRELLLRSELFLEGIQICMHKLCTAAVRNKYRRIGLSVIPAQHTEKGIKPVYMVVMRMCYKYALYAFRRDSPVCKLRGYITAGVNQVSAVIGFNERCRTLLMCLGYAVTRTDKCNFHNVTTLF